MLSASCPDSIPSDVWLLIWTDMSFRDIVAVTHVCRLWRLLAVGYPNFWSDVTLTWTNNSMSPSCNCTRCRPSDRDRTGAVNAARSTSLEYFGMLLERSRTAPLRLSLDVFSAIKTDLDPAIKLAFTKTAIRLKYLHFRGGGNILADLLATTPRLPALRELSFSPHSDNSEYLLTLRGPLELPVLEKLHGYGVEWPLPDGCSEVALPSVRFLSIWTRHLPEILTVVKACPQIQHLELDMILPRNLQELTVPTDSSARFPSLRIWRPACLRSEFLVALQSAYFPNVTLDCGDFVFADWWAIDLFRAVWEATHVVLDHYKREAPSYHQRTLISAHSRAGLRRSIDVAYEDLWHLPNMGVYLAQFSITSAKVDLSMWHYFTRAQEPYCELTELTLVAFAEHEISRAMEECKKHCHVLAFPRLRALHIQLGYPDLSMNRSVISAFILVLPFLLKLHTLSVPFLDRSDFLDQAEHVESSL